MVENDASKLNLASFSRSHLAERFSTKRLSMATKQNCFSCCKIFTSKSSFSVDVFPSRLIWVCSLLTSPEWMCLGASWPFKHLRRQTAERLSLMVPVAARGQAWSQTPFHTLAMGWRCVCVFLASETLLYLHSHLWNMSTWHWDLLNIVHIISFWLENHVIYCL